MRRLAVAPALLSMILVASPVTATDCSLMVGMSQIRQVYQGRTNDPPPEGWMLIWKSGAALAAWDQPSEWLVVIEANRCAEDSEIVRVAFGFDPYGADWPTDLHEAVAIMETRYPAADISVFLLVGGQGHVACLYNGDTVRASTTHRDFIDLMPGAVQGIGATVGPDLDVLCSQYSDKVGHLKEPGRYSARLQFLAFYGS